MVEAVDLYAQQIAGACWTIVELITENLLLHYRSSERTDL